MGLWTDEKYDTADIEEGLHTLSTGLFTASLIDMLPPPHHHTLSQINASYPCLGVWLGVTKM